ACGPPLACGLALMALALISGPVGAAPAAPAQLVLHLLDYVAIDYPETVKNGQVTDAVEFQEQIDFVTQAVAMLGTLPERPEREALVAQGRQLLALVEARRPAADVARAAGEIRAGVIKAYQVPVAPSRPPDLQAALGLYAARCAACHGAEGHGDGPAASGLNPRPTNFHDRERVDRRSAYAFYNALTLGVPGTAMTAFEDLSDDQRWALAFHVASLADSPAVRDHGRALWERGRGRAAFPDLAALATTTTAEARAHVRDDAVAVLAYLRTRPDRLARSETDL